MKRRPPRPLKLKEPERLVPATDCPLARLAKRRGQAAQVMIREHKRAVSWGLQGCDCA